MSDETKKLADQLRADGLDATAHIVELEAENKLQTERIEELEDQVPHPGDGSCDRCGRAPSVDIPTALCLELLTSTESLQTANAELKEELESRYWTLWRDYEKVKVENATLRAALEAKV